MNVIKEMSSQVLAVSAGCSFSTKVTIVILNMHILQVSKPGV
jgi:hypothetical protein